MICILIAGNEQQLREIDVTDTDCEHLKSGRRGGTCNLSNHFGV